MKDLTFVAKFAHSQDDFFMLYGMMSILEEVSEKEVRDIFIAEIGHVSPAMEDLIMRAKQLLK